MAGVLLRLLDPGPGAPTAEVGAPQRARSRSADELDLNALEDLARRVQALETAERGASGPDDPPAAGQEGGVEDGAFGEETREESEARVERRYAFLTERVRAEPVDRGWAGGAIETIEQAALGFPGTRIAAVDCRATICQLEVEHDDQDASDRFLDFFFPRVPSLPRGALHRTRTAAGRPASLVFLAREGHTLPSPED